MNRVGRILWEWGRVLKGEESLGVINRVGRVLLEWGRVFKGEELLGGHE